MQWFPVDKQARNDWRIKAVKRRFGLAGVGQLFELWSYVATEGSQTDEGRGVQRDGRPLDVAGMAEDCDFTDANGRPDVPALRIFLDYLAEIGHIDPSEWHERGIVFLPAMNRRLEAYRASKGRPTIPGQVKRGRGRPKGSRNSGNNSPEFPRSHPPLSDEIQPNNTLAPGENRPENAGSGNSGKKRGKSGNSGQTKITLPCIEGSDPLPEDKDTKTDNPKVPTPRQLVELWNRVRDPGPKVIDLTDQRKERFRRALKARPDLADWEAAILYLNRTPWANACGTGDHANFRADLDYLARPGNVVKSLERIAAEKLRGMRTGAAVGRVAPTPGKFAAAIAAKQAAEDEERGGGGEGGGS